MKKILILLVPVLAFVVGAMGGDLLGAGKTSEKAEADSGTLTDGAATTNLQDASEPAEASHALAEAEGHDGKQDSASMDWFKFPSQFFVPIIRNGTTNAVMILSLSLEIDSTARADIEAYEHSLRDALLNSLMIAANTGAFDGNFTSEPTLERLRADLLASARRVSGDSVKRVLIEDIARQAQ